MHFGKSVLVRVNMSPQHRKKYTRRTESKYHQCFIWFSAHESFTSLILWLGAKTFCLYDLAGTNRKPEKETVAKILINWWKTALFKHYNSQYLDEHVPSNTLNPAVSSGNLCYQNQIFKMASLWRRAACCCYRLEIFHWAFSCENRFFYAGLDAMLLEGHFFLHVLWCTSMTTRKLWTCSSLSFPKSE